MNREQYLHAMGIDVWKEKSLNEVIPEAANETTWGSLKQKALTCTLCDLCKTRKNVVFGSGSLQAKLMVIGEAPGENEDKQGEPFVGAAGQLLTKMLKAIGLERENVYIANILKCRPPNNRDPLPHEVEKCTPYLKQQIAFIKPKAILVLGRIAAHFLLNTDESLTRLRGKDFEYEGIPLILTYHPAYLLRAPAEKRGAYQDLLRLQQKLE